MVRKYVRKLGARRYRDYNSEAVEKAVKEVREKKLSLRKASQKYGISLGALWKYCNIAPVSNNATHPPNKKSKLLARVGHPTIFTEDEENMFVDNFGTVADWGFPLDYQQISCVISAYLNAIGRTVPCFKNGSIPGIKWIKSFLLRHNEQLRAKMCTNIKKVRAAVSPEIIKEYFNNLAKTEPLIPRGNILNYDETNFCDDPKSKVMIFRRKVKRTERIMNFTKTAFSVMFCVSDEGESLPVYIVYKAQHMWSTWINNGPKDARYNSTKSGWFDEHTFSEWFHTVVLPWAQNREGNKLLIGDNLSSHFCPEVIKACEDNHIYFVCLPKNSTHLTQPLDVGLFAPMKRVWKRVLTDWKQGEGRALASLPKDQFPSLLNRMLLNMEPNMKEIIKKSFEATGIRPFNKEKVLSRLPSTDLNKSGNVSDAMINMLKEMRHSDTTKKGKKRKKLMLNLG